jgi:dihydroorotase
LRNGISDVVCAPDTTPCIDSTAVVEYVLERARRAQAARVHPVAALTRGLGEEGLSEMATLAAAGCVAVGNIGHALSNTQLLRRALQYAATLDLKVILQPVEAYLSVDGCAHDGPIAQRLGLPGIPESAETLALARDLMLIEETGVTAHIARISCARSVAMIAAAKARGLPLTCDVAIHQLYLSEIDLVGFDPNCHVRPPLRSTADRDALRAGLANGVIDILVSDHSPHDRDAKLAPFPGTEPGISGLDSFLGLGLKLVLDGSLSMARWLDAASAAPARFLGLNQQSTIWIDPHSERRLTTQNMHSHGKNTPFMGWFMPGVVRAVWM